ncbi:dentilisin complex subunit PrcB [Treponema denticola]|uniref:Dentilisin complex subunit PrcB n=1 Tax=Treponema denticola TaxID=158 RepID=A0A9Q9BPQ5_TREDN|nr:dentilisin complex subunit PrcB [Treponema denticola]UTC89856.1 dentilisin complex subunit PrcB [Treponema denticola]UTD00793.1 dentilisin complex subunit PrcB [Treponema denticola]
MIYLNSMRCCVILLFICCVNFLGCKTLNKQPDDEVPSVPDKEAGGNLGSSFKNPEILSSPLPESMQYVYEILIQGNNLKTGLPSIVKSQEDLQTLYSVLYGNSLKAPLIDFSKKAVVIAAAGPFNTGGYSIVPVSAIKTGKVINIVFEVKSPGPKDMVTQAFTYPYVVVSVDAEPDTVIFVEINGDVKNGKLDF